MRNERSGALRPQRALWLTNSSGVTLDGGSFSVLEENAFAGEGIFDPIRPDEKRLISYATDLALNVSSRNTNEAQRISKVLIKGGVMTHESEVREKKTYTFRNADSTPRTVIVEHPVRPGYELRSEKRPAETSAEWMRFQLQVEPKQTASLVVEEARPLRTTYRLTDLTSNQIALFVSQKSINKTIEDALGKILAQQKVISDLDDQKETREAQTMKIFDDQQRLRENMKALKGSADEKTLLQRYTKELNAQEDRLEALEKESEKIESQHDEAQAALDKMLQELSFDVTL
jgi:chaperonin cofactor prefoldin